MTPLTKAEWEWIASHPDDADGKFILRLRDMSKRGWSHVEDALLRSAITSLRKTIAQGGRQ